MVAYLQGTPPGTALGRYYARPDRSGGVVQGRARGTVAGLVGLRGSVRAGQLERLLMGRHAVTGVALLGARGSAGRFQASQGQIHAVLADAPPVLSLAQAAGLAKVSTRYLRQLAEDDELAQLAAARPGPADERDPGDGLAGAGSAAELDPVPKLRVIERRDHLRAFRDPGNRWLVERGELSRFMLARQPPTVVIGYPCGGRQPVAGARDRHLRTGSCLRPLHGRDPVAILGARVPGPSRRPAVRRT